MIDHSSSQDLNRSIGSIGKDELRSVDAIPPANSAEPAEPAEQSGVNLSAPFIARPVATTLLSIALILAGIAGYFSLSISSLPLVEFAVINVNASLPGADPETMASAVAMPLERQFSRIAGVNEMTSVSSTGSVSISLQFELDRSINGAARDVQAAINAARSQLPSNLPQNPSYRRVNPGDSASLVFALTSDTMTPAQLYDQADSILAQKISQVSGVGQVQIGGSAKPAVRIESNPDLLAHTGLGLEALRSVIGTINVNRPKGYLSNAESRVSVGATDQLFTAKQYAPLIVSTNAGPVTSAAAANGIPTSLASALTKAAPAALQGNSGSATLNASNSAVPLPGVVRLSDIGQVVDSVEDTNTFGSFNGKPAILVNVMRTPGTNVIKMVDQVRALLPMLQASVPPTVKIDIALDRTIAIRESVREVTRSLAIAILLVIVVVYLFLRDVRSTLIPSVSVPLSLFGTFAIMYLLGYTLDNLSLMALTISTGFVVDDAIVVMENIVRHLEEGMTPLRAALTGSREIGFTVVSMSLSLIAVFIPILLMEGIVGRLFREFAITLSVSILVSLAVSLTTTPMLSAMFLNPMAPAMPHTWFYRVGERALNWMIEEYDRGLKWVLRHQGIVLGITLLTVALNVYLYTIVPKGFFPEMDSGRMSGQIKGQQDVSFATLKEKSIALVRTLSRVSGIQNVMLSIGGGGAGNTASLSVFLAPAAEREKNGDTATAIMEKVRKVTGGVPGASLVLQSSQELKIGARSAASLYQYSLTSDKLAELNEWSPKMMAAMQKIPVLKDVSTDQQDKGLRAQLVIDRDTAARLGVSVLAIDNTLADAFSQRQVATTYMPLNQYHVVLEVAPEFRSNPDALKKIFVKSSSGTMVPLSDVTHFEEKRIPLAVNHQSQSPAATLSFNLADGASLSQATEAIEQARIKIGMPSEIHGGFEGTAKAFTESLSSEPILILLALVTVYIVLGMLYENLIHPLTILSTLPSAGVGAIIALLLCKTELSVIAMIGIILLIGIVKKNAIMMIDFALDAERKQGKTPIEAIHEACLLRFRPIMMTTMAALLGAVPLAFGTGPGSEIRRPLGITIIGGLIVSQALTLFTTPVVYLFFDRIQARIGSALRNRRSGKSRAVAAGAVATLLLLVAMHAAAQAKETAKSNAELPSLPQPNFTLPLFLRASSVDYGNPARAFPSIRAPYIARTVEAPRFGNTPLLKDLAKGAEIDLSLSDAVALAVENNFDIAIARYNLDIADADLLRARAGSSLRGVSTGIVANTLGGTTSTITAGGGPGGTSVGSGGSGSGPSGLVLSTNGAGPTPESLDPALTGMAQIERAITPETTEVLSGTNLLGQNTNQYNFGYIQGFLPGSQLTVSFNNQRIASNSERNLYNPMLQSYFQARVQQHLLQGLGIGLNGRFIRQALNDRQITDSSFRQQVLYTVNQVENIYWALVSAYEDVKSKQRSLEQSRQLASDNRKQLAAGTLARLDVMNADSQVSNDEQALISSQNNLEYQELLIKQAIARDLEDPVLSSAPVIPTDRINMARDASEDLPLENAIRKAYEQNPNVEQGILQVKNDEITMKALKNALLPTADLYGFYSANALGGAQNPQLNCGSSSGPFVACPSGYVAENGYGGTFANLFNGTGPDKAVGVSVTIPLRNRTAQSDQIRSQLEYRQAQLRLQQILTQIRIQVINARYALKNDRALIESAVAAQQYAAESLNAEQLEFKLGESATADVLQAQRNLAAAENNTISAKAAFARDRAALHQVLSDTLEEYGISLPAAASGTLPGPLLIPGVSKAEAPSGGKP